MAQQQRVGIATDGPMPPFYDPELKPLMQANLSALADIDLAYERALEDAMRATGSGALKACLRASLEAQYRTRREPYLRQLARLEARMRP